MSTQQQKPSSLLTPEEKEAAEKLLADILGKEKRLQARWLKASDPSERDQYQAHLKKLIQAKQALKIKLDAAATASTETETSTPSASTIESNTEAKPNTPAPQNSEQLYYELGSTTPKTKKRGQGKRAAIAAALLLVTGTGVFISQSDIDFRHLLAQFSPEYQQQTSQIAQLAAEIDELIARLNTKEQSFKENVTAAEKELQTVTTAKDRNAAESLLQFYQAINDLTQKTIFQGSELAGLREKKTQADALIKQEQFPQAIPALEEIKQGYLDLLANLDMTEPMFAAQKEALAKQSDWLDFKRKYEVGPIKPEAAAENQLRLANDERDSGKFILAHNDYLETRQAYLNLLNGPAAREAIAAMKRRNIIAELKKEMIVVPSGSFMMGDLTGDGETDETPTRRVFIKAFALKKTEVTFDQYDMFADATGQPRPDDGGWGRGDRPVINVSWHDAVAFAEWLSKQTGKNFRLPTEAEWEYAARAGNAGKYSWGDEPSARHANGSEDYDWPNDGYYKKTSPVASYQANQFGLYDMHGNVLEWTQDCWKLNYELSPLSSRAWLRGDCNKRVRRGGSWVDPPLLMRSSERFWSVSTTKSSISGFRLAQDLTTPNNGSAAAAGDTVSSR